MEVSALRYSGGIGLHGRSPLLRLQSDERLISLIRRGNNGAFEVLVSRYHSRLLAFCRHLLGSKEDAEDVLQEVLAAAFNAILADERPINVRPWLYRIARNRSLNHLRRIQAIGVDSMDIHFSDYGATTADKVHSREQFRLLVRDIQTLPETQRTALVLREMDALSYEQIAEAMDTTVPGVKSLLVRARISLAEAAEARQLSCDEVRLELAEVAEGLHKRPPALVRRHIRSCTRCSTFQGQLKQTNKVLAALMPLGPIALLRKLLIAHLGHTAGTGSGAGAASAASSAGAASATGAAGATTGASAGGLAVSQAAAAAGTAGGLGSAGSLVSAGAGALATKAAAGLAAAALVTAGAVAASHTVTPHRTQLATVQQHTSGGAGVSTTPPATLGPAKRPSTGAKAATSKTNTQTVPTTPATTTTTTTTAATTAHPATDTTTSADPQTTTTQTQTDPTILSSSAPGSTGQATDTCGPTNSSTGSDSSSGTSSTGTTTSTTTSTTPTTTDPSGGASTTPPSDTSTTSQPTTSTTGSPPPTSSCSSPSTAPAPSTSPAG